MLTNFSLYQENIFRKLREGTADVEKQEFFFNAIELHANTIARRCNSKVSLSPTRIWEVQELWENDLNSLITDGKIETSPYPCEYKHAAFLCFWLRRRVIVESAMPLDPALGVTNKDYNDYKSEYISFYIALHLVFYHAYFPKTGGEDSEEVFSGYDFPSELVHEALVMLHHKNVSPHALYLFFKALLTRLHSPISSQLTSVV